MGERRRLSQPLWQLEGVTLLKEDDQRDKDVHFEKNVKIGRKK